MPEEESEALMNKTSMIGLTGFNPFAMMFVMQLQVLQQQQRYLAMCQKLARF